ncbi:MAG TPA: DNA methylase [Phycisphaerae bacterium]|nr:DNA methylase [Phycisphaerae bacterium]
MDHNGNAHDLDYVLERGGTPDKQGAPVAFIETAWRRYTKHSRNKAQEIQGAIIPLVETYRHSKPFVGAILAGVFTQGALAQLSSLGFTVLYLPYESVVEVFGRFGIDAAFGEDTSDREFQRKVAVYEALTSERRKGLARALLKKHSADVDAFIRSLETSIARRLESILLLPLYGRAYEATSIAEAVDFLQRHVSAPERLPVLRYEIQIRYGNGDRIEATFQDRETAIQYLRGLATGI